MSKQWIPTTEQIRTAYSIDVQDEYRDPISAPANRRANERYFDAWLAAHDAEVREPLESELAATRQELHESRMTGDFDCCASGSCEACRRPSGYSRERREEIERETRDYEPPWVRQHEREGWHR